MDMVIGLLQFILFMIAVIASVAFVVSAYIGYVVIQAIRKDSKTMRSR